MVSYCLAEFEAAVEADVSLQEKLKAAVTPADVVAIANSTGFAVIEEDLLAAKAEQEQFVAFLEAVNADASLLDKMRNITDSAAIVEVAGEAGFCFSKTLLEKAQLLSQRELAKRELTDEELDMASGGIAPLVALGIGAGALFGGGVLVGWLYSL